MARKILFAILAVCLLGPMGSFAYGKSVSGYHKRNGAYYCGACSISVRVFNEA